MITRFPPWYKISIPESPGESGIMMMLSVYFSINGINKIKSGVRIPCYEFQGHHACGLGSPWNYSCRLVILMEGFA